MSRLESIEINRIVTQEIQATHRLTASAYNPSLKRLERIEQLTGDLIRLIAKTKEKSANTEEQLAELEIILARNEWQHKCLNEQNISILRRLSKLEKKDLISSSPRFKRMKHV